MLTRRAGLLLAGTAAAAVAAVVAWQVTGDGGTENGDPAAASTSAAPMPSVPSDAAGGAASVLTPDPMSGQTLATDDPVVVTTRESPVSITFYGWDPVTQQAQAGGYVAGVVEDGGTCTLTLRLGGQTVTGTSTARPDAASTACGAVVVPGSQLGNGAWEAVLSYESPQHVGSSDPVTIEVAR
ncbi:hypothetical protein [Blastococcus litoris]|uniref:hypothetical protein n=1 Tax=Blastococcus litoris TaxID=2171622 RepID=UPI0013DFDAE6|nr:hypothetical protein [Blastococcus litoris]